VHQVGDQTKINIYRTTTNFRFTWAWDLTIHTRT